MSVTPATIPAVSIEEYLSRPQYEHCEYVDGRAIELNVGSKTRSRIQVRCGAKLMEYADARENAYVAAELHCRLEVGGRTRYRLPDVALVLGDDDRDARHLDRAPDLVVEIRSPDDRTADLIGKLEDYFSNGCKMAWVILPEESSVLVFTPTGSPRTYGRKDTLEGGEVLPGLSIAVNDILG